MALCGFNEKMLDGLKKFHESLVENILKKKVDNVEKI